MYHDAATLLGQNNFSNGVYFHKRYFACDPQRQIRQVDSQSTYVYASPGKPVSRIDVQIEVVRYAKPPHKGKRKAVQYDLLASAQCKAGHINDLVAGQRDGNESRRGDGFHELALFKRLDRTLTYQLLQQRHIAAF
jgi:hypothetical protein